MVMDKRNENSLIFYMFELNSSCRAVSILIETLNLDVETKRIDMRLGEHLTEDFKKVYIQ